MGSLTVRVGTSTASVAYAVASTSRLLVGARAKADPDGPVTLAQAFNQANSIIGPLKVTRVFCTALPAKHSPITPDGVCEVISFKSATNADLASFVTSMRAGSMLAFHHEPEGPTDGYATGADFVTEFNTYQSKARAAGGKLGMIAGGYQYRTAGRGYDGSFLPPDADWYAIDTYRDGSTENAFGAIVPLTDVAEFQRWLSFVKGRGKPLGITEYGRGTVDGFGELASSYDKRPAVIAQDGPYLRSLGFFCWALWYSNFGPDGRHWMFTDQASIDAWRTQASV